MCSPSPPPAPDYTGAATAQGAANVDTAVAQAKLNNPNVVSPYGTQTFTEGANPSDRPTVTQTLSPDQQALFDQNQQTKMQLSQLGTAGADSLNGIIGKPVDFSSAPTVGNYDDTRNTVYNAMLGRVNEDYDKAKDASNSDLYSRGIAPGTKAYQDNIYMLDRAKNDATNQAQISAGNAAVQAQTADEGARQQAIAEILAQRQTPLNEISALTSGAQVSNPFATPGVAQNTSVGQTPVFNAAQQSGAFNTDLYNQQVSSSNSTTGALGAAAAAAIFY